MACLLDRKICEWISKSVSELILNNKNNNKFTVEINKQLYRDYSLRILFFFKIYSRWTKNELINWIHIYNIKILSLFIKYLQNKKKYNWLQKFILEGFVIQ